MKWKNIGILVICVDIYAFGKLQFYELFFSLEKILVNFEVKKAWFSKTVEPDVGKVNKRTRYLFVLFTESDSE